MSIIAIDPGSTASAYVELNGELIMNKGKLPNKDMATLIENAYAEPHRLQTFVLAIEMPACYGMAVGKSVFETCRWVGIFQHAFGVGNTHLIYRKAPNKEEGIEGVCMHLCKNNRANDSNIRQAIIDRYPATGGGKTPQIGIKSNPGPLFGVSKDIWAALATAITFQETFERSKHDGTKTTTVSKEVPGQEDQHNSDSEPDHSRGEERQDIFHGNESLW